MDEHEAHDDGWTGPPRYRDGRSAPPEPDARVTRSGPPVRHRPWSTLLLVAHVCATVMGAVFLALGVVTFAGTVSAGESPPSDGIQEPWGIVLGIILIIVGLVVGIPGAVLTRLTLSGRREAELGRPGVLRRVATATVVIAGLCALSTCTGGRPSASAAVGLVFSGLYALPAVVMLRRTRASRELPDQ